MGFNVGSGKGFGAKPGKFGKSGGFGKQSDVDDPLDGVEYSDDLNADASAEFEALQQGFADRAQAERKRFQDATDSEFWFAVCFKTREDKEVFLKALKIHKNMMGDKYLDGHKLAKMLGVKLE